MNALRASFGRNGRFLVVVAVLFGVGAWGLAVEPEKTEPAKKETPKEPEKGTIKFEMDKKPWRSVLEWLTEQMDSAFVGNVIPTGTFTLFAASLWISASASGPCSRSFENEDRSNTVTPERVARCSSKCQSNQFWRPHP